jgi:hypothetical protein
MIATVLLPRLTIAEQSQQLPQPRQPGPMVPGGLDGERQLLRTGLRHSASRYPQEQLVSSRLARKRQLLHPLKTVSVGILAVTAFSSGSIEMVTNPVQLAELAIEKQAQTLLMPVRTPPAQ